MALIDTPIACTMLAFPICFLGSGGLEWVDSGVVNPVGNSGGAANAFNGSISADGGENGKASEECR
jgi:hypothetical protein